MNIKDIAVEYRLSHWAQIIKDRSESGQSIKDYCKNAGIHENAYYYWLRKLRISACEGLAKIQGNTASLAHPRFTEVKLVSSSVLAPAPGACQSQVSIEFTGVRINASSEYPIDKLVVLLKEVARLC